MTNTSTDQVSIEWIVEQAETLGSEHGTSAATWVDGWTEEGARSAIKMDDDGDPAFDDHFPSGDPLSGEWADGLTEFTLIENELGIEYESLTEWEVEQVVEAYERFYRDSFVDEVVRAARVYVESCDQD